MHEESGRELIVCNAEQTAGLLDFDDVADAVARAAMELDAGAIMSPERLALPLREGGSLLSMPASAADIAIHKLVNIQPANRGKGLPTVSGIVTVCDATTGLPLCVLDGPRLTGCRTAAVSMLAIRLLAASTPRRLLMFGTGAQAGHHVRALAAMHPQCEVWVKGLDAQASHDFCSRVRNVHSGLRPCDAGVPDDIDVVITLTTSRIPIYDEAARPETLVIGVGAFRPDMAELGRRTIQGSELFADDPKGARNEAGDFMQADVNWSSVRSLAHALRNGRDRERPAVFKSVGTAAWDLAAARVALTRLQGSI